MSNPLCYLLLPLFILTSVDVFSQEYTATSTCTDKEDCTAGIFDRGTSSTLPNIQARNSMCDLAKDSAELVNFYNVLEGPNWEIQEGWLKDNLENWYGINLTSDGCNVGGINTWDYFNHDNGLKGDLPVLDLPELTSLSLSFSQLHLNIDGAICFKKMPKLRSLFIYESVINGAWPDLSNCPDISGLGFSFTQIKGDLPNFSILPNLSFLEAIGNQITGTIPDISSHNFRSFSLARNQMEGTIPKFTNSTSLYNLSLGENRFEGNLPEFERNLFLERLFLYDNQFDGIIPDYDHLVALEILNISENKLIGGLPKLPTENLKFAIFNNNNLSGIVPDFSQMIALEELDISNNKFTFEHLLPNFNTVNTEYIYFPQQLIYVDTTFVLEEGNALSIDLEIDNGLGSNTYQWFKDGILYRTLNGDNTIQFNNLATTDAGIYKVEVTNPNAPDLVLESYPIELIVNRGCEVALNYEITNPKCGEKDGSIQILVTGSNNPYTISWDNNLGNNLIQNNLSPGIYKVSISQDACLITEEITLANSGKPISDIVPQTSNISCFGEQDGQISISSISGGTEPFQYKINDENFQNSPIFENLIANDYSVEILDSDGCTYSSNISIPEPEPLMVTLLPEKEIIEKGQATTINTEIITSSFPVNYVWSCDDEETISCVNCPNPVVTPSENTIYTLTITDNNNCTTSESVTIKVHQCEINLDYEVTNATCGQNNGSIELFIIGNTNPYTISWGNTTENSPIQENLNIGTYDVSVTQGVCELTQTIMIEETSPPIEEIEIEVQDVNCVGQQNGSLAVLAVKGGVSPFEYKINNQNFQNNRVFTNLNIGVYSLEIKDANNCSFTVNETVNAPPKFTVSIKSEQTKVIDGEQIEIVSTLENPFGKVSYFWESNSEARMNCRDCQDIEVSPDKTMFFYLTVIDEKGCVAKDSLQILVESCRGEENYVLTPNGDGYNDYLEFNCPNDLPSSKFALVITNRWGDKIYEAEEYNNNWNGINQNGQPQPEGTYYYTMRFNIGEGEIKYGNVLVLR